LTDANLQHRGEARDRFRSKTRHPARLQPQPMQPRSRIGWLPGQGVHGPARRERNTPLHTRRGFIHLTRV